MVLLFVQNGQRDGFEEFERQAVEIMARYGGVIEQRVRLQSTEEDLQPDEVHLVRFPNEASFDAYRADPDTRALAERRSRVIRETVVWREEADVGSNGAVETLDPGTR